TFSPCSFAKASNFVTTAGSAPFAFANSSRETSPVARTFGFRMTDTSMTSSSGCAPTRFPIGWRSLPGRITFLIAIIPLIESLQQPPRLFSSTHRTVLSEGRVGAFACLFALLTVGVNPERLSLNCEQRRGRGVRSQLKGQGRVPVHRIRRNLDLQLINASQASRHRSR